MEMFGWSTIAALGLGAAAIVAFYIPPLRKYAIIAGAAIAGLFFVYAKGWKDKGEAEQKKRDKVVGKLTEKYNEVDRRTDNRESIDKRLRGGDF